MILSTDEITFIQTVIETAKIAEIDSVIIEPGAVRAADVDKTTLIFQQNTPTFQFNTLGINRLDLFRARFNIIKNLDNFSVQATTSTSKIDQKEVTFVRSLIMTGAGTKIDFRCANPATIAAPKSLLDPNKYQLSMNAIGVQRISQAISAMQCDSITLKADSGKLLLIAADVNNDQFQYKFENPISLTGSEQISAGDDFEFKYPAKKIATLFKANPVCNFLITSRGMIKISVNNLTTVTFPLA